MILLVSWCCRRVTGHSVEVSVARVISTTCSTCEAVATTTTSGRTTALSAGPTRTFCLTSSSPRINATENSSEQVNRVLWLNARLIALRFYVPLYTELVISKPFFPANLLTYVTEETKSNSTQQKQEKQVLCTACRQCGLIIRTYTGTQCILNAYTHIKYAQWRRSVENVRGEVRKHGRIRGTVREGAVASRRVDPG